MREKVIAFFWVKTSSRHTVSHRWHHINISDQMAFRKGHAFKATQKGLSVLTLGCKYSCLLLRKRQMYLFFLFLGFIISLSFKQCVWLSSSLLIKQQLVFIYFNGPELLEEFTDCETDVFVHFYHVVEFQQHLSLALCGFSFCIHSRGRGGRRGRHMAARSTKHVISMNKDGPWGHLLLWCDLLVSV